jgi:hypothetical protein
VAVTCTKVIYIYLEKMAPKVTIFGWRRKKKREIFWNLSWSYGLNHLWLCGCFNSYATKRGKVVGPTVLSFSGAAIPM